MKVSLQLMQNNKIQNTKQRQINSPSFGTKVEFFEGVETRFLSEAGSFERRWNAVMNPITTAAKRLLEGLRSYGDNIPPVIEVESLSITSLNNVTRGCVFELHTPTHMTSVEMEQDCDTALIVAKAVKELSDDEFKKTAIIEAFSKPNRL